MFRNLRNNIVKTQKCPEINRISKRHNFANSFEDRNKPIQMTIKKSRTRVGKFVSLTSVSNTISSEMESPKLKIIKPAESAFDISRSNKSILSQSPMQVRTKDVMPKIRLQDVSRWCKI